MSRLQHDTWWRMPAAKAQPSRVRRGSSPFRWAAPYWVVGFGVAALLQADVLPMKQWLTSAASAPTESPAVTEPKHEAPAPQPEPEPVALAAAAAPPATRQGTTFLSFGDPTRGLPDRPLLLPPPGPAAPAPQALLDAQLLDAKLPEHPLPSPHSAHRPSRKRSRANANQPRRQAAAAPLTKPVPPTRARHEKSKTKTISASGGKSCAAAIASYRENVKMGDKSMPADITAARYGAVLNRGSYFAQCGVPDSMRLHICAAVQNGVAVGVTVTTTPGSRRVASCVAGAVRGLSFPSHPRMDVTRTTFE